MEKTTLDAENQSIPFKLIIWSDEQGVCKVKEYPKTMDPSLHLSGCHLFRDNPEKDHYDHFKDGKEWKDYDPNNKYPFSFQQTVSGAILVM